MTVNVGVMTMEKALDLKGDNEVVMLLVHPALLPSLVGWLDSRNLDMVQVQNDPNPDALPEFVVSPRRLE